jgi:hypothetical protein
MLGFKSTSSVLRKVISDVIELEIKDNRLKQQDGLIVIGRPLLFKMLSNSEID